MREIRVQDRGQFRVIYVAKFEDAIYVLHAFHKKTQQIRAAELDSAKRQYQSVLKRFEMCGMRWKTILFAWKI